MGGDGGESGVCEDKDGDGLVAVDIVGEFGLGEVAVVLAVVRVGGKNVGDVVGGDGGDNDGDREEEEEVVVVVNGERHFWRERVEREEWGSEVKGEVELKEDRRGW
ncbi:hypothetical protein Lal_00032753 [Lupinus albus]|nr:hypothetical protein Lal_00032753 [Lupinus albus]